MVQFQNFVFEIKENDSLAPDVSPMLARHFVVNEELLRQYMHGSKRNPSLT